MNTYTNFAQVYDTFMDNVDYKSWADYLIRLLKKNNINDGIILDLGCGTGSITKLLSDAGYDMIGIDNSADMLSIAMEKRGDDESILYLLQDMREMELYGTVAAVISSCDCMNYITDYEDLVTVFKLVNNYLDPKGLFIFDINTISKFNSIGDSVIAEDREDCSFIWENSYYDDEHINEYNLSIFIKGDDDRYDKFSEVHYQRAYSLDEIKNALSEAGLEFICAYNAFTEEDASEDNERIYIIAKENGK